MSPLPPPISPTPPPRSPQRGNPFSKSNFRFLRDLGLWEFSEILYIWEIQVNIWGVYKLGVASRLPCRGNLFQDPDFGVGGILGPGGGETLCIFKACTSLYIYIYIRVIGFPLRDIFSCPGWAQGTESSHIMFPLHNNEAYMPFEGKSPAEYWALRTYSFCKLTPCYFAYLQCETPGCSRSPADRSL